MNLAALRALLVAVAILGINGCATVTGDATQAINIQTVDANGRPIDGMACRIVNGSAEYMGDSPLFGLRVRRSSTPLVAECKRNGYAIARALIIPRADLASGSTAQLLLPGGSSMLIIDHFSGFMYKYPRWIKAQAGADMIFDQSDERGLQPTPGIITRQFDAQVRYASGVQDARVD
ncbi:MAG: hypothetical protein ABJA83_09290 [Burkholderiaceae bacterium]